MIRAPRRKLKTHCKRGHAYSQKTTRFEITEGGHIKRRCKLCNSMKTRLKYATDPDYRARLQRDASARYWRRKEARQCP